MDRKTGLIVLGGCGVLALAIAMFMLGRHTGLAAAASRGPVVPPAATLTQTPRSLQELLPQPGPSQPGEGQGNCKPIVLFYYQGRLYQIQLGPEGQQGTPTPSSPPEYFPITPYQGPAIPGLPFPMPNMPGSPGLPPVGPRF
jgi:hypothetical protein